MWEVSARHPAHFRGAEGGTAALEFAIVSPVLILMFLGMMLFGLYLTLLHEVQELASSGARASVAGVTQAERSQLANQFIYNFIANSGLLISSDLTVTTATIGSPPTEFQVSVSYNLKDTPLPLLGRLVNVPNNTIQRTATVQFGGY
jgi:Flp pilus assembly protein TadG